MVTRSRSQDLALIEAFIRMRSQGAKTGVVTRSLGQIVGIHALENIGKMMIENAIPGWRFGKWN
jgi:hypothetical protein